MRIGLDGVMHALGAVANMMQHAHIIGEMEETVTLELIRSQFQRQSQPKLPNQPKDQNHPRLHDRREAKAEKEEKEVRVEKVVMSITMTIIIMMKMRKMKRKNGKLCRLSVFAFYILKMSDTPCNYQSFK